MKAWTYAEAKAELEQEMDLAGDDFVTAAEWLSYWNNAIDDAEALIHDLYEDYFFTYAWVALVTGQALYAYPTDVYAGKVRGFYYKSGNEKYRIKRVRNLDDTIDPSASAQYAWLPVNTSAAGYQLEIFPTSRETAAQVAKLFYIRNAKRIAVTTDVIDIPEFMTFLKQHVRCAVKAKEHAGIIPPGEAAKLFELKTLMSTTLQNMQDDTDDEVPEDRSHYEEHA